MVSIIIMIYAQVGSLSPFGAMVKQKYSVRRTDDKYAATKYWEILWRKCNNVESEGGNRVPSPYDSFSGDRSNAPSVRHDARE